jgi:hypothetical protein
MSISPAKNAPSPIKLKLDKKFQPCPLDEGDEAYPNGIFHFNISRMLAFIDAHPEDFPLEHIPVADIPSYAGASLDEATVRSADLSRPVLLAEIAPPPSHPSLRSAVLNVECSEDQYVEWLWTETPDGRFVSGYQLVPRLKLPT